ncbi:unnamed protein product [Eruca vesicaria subsp. sativa]|uniref:F-box domain-containing protein n=1 Tax=Eruca vesicaria subsp. sativa TaxID=29727 RepID=A0ABC8KC87_ERUVS|nr:unnamed protein product [Eruca vesicaria subsp. sativa]
MARVFKKRLLSNQPWMKKRRRRERSRDDKSQPNHIPLDLALDIVSRLPAKSIMRYQCVSKLWSSFITLPSFINSFTSRSTSRSPTLLVTFASGWISRFVFSFPQHHIPDGSTCSPIYNAHGHKWTRESFVLHLPYEIVQKYYIQFWGTTDAGEFVFAPSDFYETFYTLYLDPRRKSIRKVFFEINMDDLRRRCGLDSINGKSTLQVFPNHIESLFSL